MRKKKGVFLATSCQSVLTNVYSIVHIKRLLLYLDLHITYMQ